MNGPPPEPTTAGPAPATADRPLHFAFLTTEFPTTLPTGGGLASYVDRMTTLLAKAGHAVDIFVPVREAGPQGPAEITRNGCRVHHVDTRRNLAFRAATRLISLAGFDHVMKRIYWTARARAIGRAVERVHAKTPFNVVHSADCFGIGLGVASRAGRLNVVRCSSAVDLYMACDGQSGRQSRSQVALEEKAILNADLVFAPSRLTAHHYSRKHGRKVLALPTPVYLDPPESAAIPASAPPRYLIHFAANLLPRKGTDLIAAALPLALAETPDLAMLWVGVLDEDRRRRLLDPLGAAAGQVVHMNYQDKATLHALIKGATCAVLPSLIDNLPNAVLESLMLGVPVIGSRDSSIDELVEDGVTGVLVANGSVPDLARAMSRAWRGDLGLRQDRPWAQSPIGRAYQPDSALAAYLQAIADARQ